MSYEKLISIVIAVYNEEKNIPFVIKDIEDAFRNIDYNYEVIFINDGSSDKTSDVLNHFSKKNENIRVVDLKINRGKSNALNLGFRAAKGDVVFMMDGDGQFTAKDWWHNEIYIIDV